MAVIMAVIIMESTRVRRGMRGTPRMITLTGRKSRGITKQRRRRLGKDVTSAFKGGPPRGKS
jgi:hypothetical protein